MIAEGFNNRILPISRLSALPAVTSTIPRFHHGHHYIIPKGCSEVWLWVVADLILLKSQVSLFFFGSDRPVRSTFFSNALFFLHGLPLIILFNPATTARTVFTSSKTIIMQAKAFILVTLASFGQARFGQEGAIQGIIQALSDFGPPGAAGTLAGQTTGVLLAGGSACAKVRGPRRCAPNLRRH